MAEKIFIPQIQLFGELEYVLLIVSQAVEITQEADEKKPTEKEVLQFWGITLKMKDSGRELSVQPQSVAFAVLKAIKAAGYYTNDEWNALEDYLNKAWDGKDMAPPRPQQAPQNSPGPSPIVQSGLKN